MWLLIRGGEPTSISETEQLKSTSPPYWFSEQVKDRGQ